MVPDLLHVLMPDFVLWLITIHLEAMANCAVVHVVEVNASLGHIGDDVVYISSDKIEFASLKDTFWQFLHLFDTKFGWEKQWIVFVSYNIS